MDLITMLLLAAIPFVLVPLILATDTAIFDKSKAQSR